MDTKIKMTAILMTDSLYRRLIFIFPIFCFTLFSTEILSQTGDEKEKAVALTKAGQSMQEKGLYNEAIKYFDMALDIFDNPFTRYYKAVSLEKTGKYKEAYQILNEIKDKDELKEKKTAILEKLKDLKEFAVEYGTIRVVSTPDEADVYLDGDKQNGVTPLTLKKIPVGVHTLLIVRGFFKGSSQIDLAPSENKTVEITLESEIKYGFLKVAGGEHGWNLVIGYRFIPLPLAEAIPLNAGEYNMQIKVTGFKPKEYNVVIQPGMTTAIKAQTGEREISENIQGREPKIESQKCVMQKQEQVASDILTLQVEAGYSQTINQLHVTHGICTNKCTNLNTAYRINYLHTGFFLTSLKEDFNENDFIFLYGFTFNTGFSDGDVEYKNEFMEFSLGLPVLRLLYNIHSIIFDSDAIFFGPEAGLLVTIRNSNSGSYLYAGQDDSSYNFPHAGFHSGFMFGYMIFENLGFQAGISFDYQPYVFINNLDESAEFLTRWIFQFRIDLIGRFGIW
jgi:hypothetical protein